LYICSGERASILSGRVYILPGERYDKELDVPWYYAFTHPLAGAIFEGIIAQSAWRVLTLLTTLLIFLVSLVIVMSASAC